MRQVRRKIADPSVRTYLLKAKEEGIKLSWNRFEEMLPQDGFGRLGLYCFDCLQGPCRLNPFGKKEERTTCGLTKDNLVLKALYRFIGAEDMETDIDELDCGCEDKAGLVGIANYQIEKLRKVSGSRKVQGISRQVGLGLLKEDHINVCLEEVSPVMMNMIQQLAEDLGAEAEAKGAKGYNIVVAGDISPVFPFPSVTSSGGTEFAVLTGLLDLYVVGQKGLGLGKNVVSSYHTLYVQPDQSICKVKIKGWLNQAADAFAKRDKTKILASKQVGDAQLVDLNLDQLKDDLASGYIKGICILGGGTTVKMTQDALICEAAVRMSADNIRCFTYGNAAVTLGKYGYLNAVDGAAPLASCIGGEADVVKILDLVKGVENGKVIALFPELTTPRDLSVALALAGAGVKVLTAVVLPLAGSKEVQAEVNKLVTYYDPSDYVDEAFKVLAAKMLGE